MKILLTILFLLVSFTNTLFAQDDSTSFSNTMQTFLSQYHPRVGFMSQFGADIQNTSEKTSSNFLIRNIRFYLTGTAGEDISYYFQGDFNGTFKLLDLKLSYKIGDNFKIEGGRLKSPFGVEFLTNDAKLLFVNRSTVARTIGPLRQIGIQLRSSFLDKRINLVTGAFNGDTSFPRKEISLYIGKVSTIPIKEDEILPDLQLEIGGSLAFSNDRYDLQNHPFVDKNVVLYGFDTKISFQSYWLALEYDAAASDKQRTRDGFYIDAGWKINSEFEIAGRFDWYGNYYTRFNEPEGFFRKYIAGINYYPLDKIKVQLNLERDHANEVNTGYLNFQYAINFE